MTSTPRSALRRSVPFCVSFLFLALLLPPASKAATAHAQLVTRDGEPKVEARLLIEQNAAGPSRVGVLFDLAPGWHLYWRSSGSTGLPPVLDWNASGADAVFGETQWPAPSAFGDEDDESRSYGYEHQVLLSRTLRLAPPRGPDGSLSVDGDVLVCEAECVPAMFRLERSLGSPLAGFDATAETALFESYAELVPVEPETLAVRVAAHYSQSAIRPGDDFEAAIEVGSPNYTPGSDVGGGATFFPDDSDSVELRVAAVDGNVVTLAGTADPDEPTLPERLTGVLSLRADTGRTQFIEIDQPFPSAAVDASVQQFAAGWKPQPSRSVPSMGLAAALLLALLGGLILNLMPCVLPVLAIKVFSISEMAEAARNGRGEVLRHGIAYTTGIVGSMAVLATAVLALRAAGHSVGWGFQFQEPIYVAAISAVLVAFASNLFGVFEIRGGAGALADLGQQATGARRSFFEGLLAVALATPCSAPFLGTAVGFAFASAPIVIMGIFLAVGFGLAAPFLLITCIPGWARFMPRSGPWMGTVRSGLGFALLATVVWLLWIFGGSAGLDGAVLLVGFLVALSFALWCFGQLQRSSFQRTAFGTGIALIVLSFAGLNSVGTRVETPPAEATESAGSGESSELASSWSAWSPEAVRDALAAGSPAFVRFTADWCITCKVNERVALQDESVVRALEAGGFALLVADWTQRDEAIRSELSRHGRAGVPLYLVYDPQKPDVPELLPEVLTADRVLASLGEVSARAARDSDHPQMSQSAGSAGR